ncbi:hypothetical protein COLO4_35878 [Corchorus olitorius]|uniref:Uncharacterized protein n=1 Tax=Corchorus olitorius TaxID=93759 RepID=A0A1R3GCA1_9ROSI|nr:hypothetical protein COLO4_35878 [Corchorus olitorius]
MTRSGVYSPEMSRAAYEKTDTPVEKIGEKGQTSGTQNEALVDTPYMEASEESYECAFRAFEVDELLNSVTDRFDREVVRFDEFDSYGISNYIFGGGGGYLSL